MSWMIFLVTIQSPSYSSISIDISNWYKSKLGLNTRLHCHWTLVSSFCISHSSLFVFIKYNAKFWKVVNINKIESVECYICNWLNPSTLNWYLIGFYFSFYFQSLFYIIIIIVIIICYCCCSLRIPVTVLPSPSKKLIDFSTGILRHKKLN